MTRGLFFRERKVLAPCWRRFASSFLVSGADMSDPYAYKRDARLQARLAAEIQALLKLPGNSECADCGATRTVRFCSVTLGVFLCNHLFKLFALFIPLFINFLS